MIRLALFGLASLALLPLSWRSLGNVRAHGFYRFFAFEFLTALILWNAPLWFRDPFCLRQWAAWTLGAVSIALVIEGFRLLRIVGRPSGAGPETNLAFENTTQLVTIGAYRWIRHPLYASLLALGWCAWLKQPLEGVSAALAAGATAALVATALAEERENRLRFGPAYGDYCRRTRRFIPFVF
ncbi:MAG: isoprenylcysteine carboxylmethyltransferase family protein [Terracidiphilus sp.]